MMTETDRGILRSTQPRLEAALVDLRQCEQHRRETVRTWLSNQKVPDLPAETKDALLTILERIATARPDVSDEILRFADRLLYVAEALCVFDAERAEGR